MKNEDEPLCLCGHQAPCLHTPFMGAPYQPPMIPPPAVKPYLPDPVLVALWEVATAVVPSHLLPITTISPRNDSFAPQGKGRRMNHNAVTLRGAA